MTEIVTTFLALLAMACQLALLVAVVLALGGLASPSLARLTARVRNEVAATAVPLALAVAVVATAGSLYFSEVAHFTPCRLCWYQRVAMYPLVPVLAAAWRRAASPPEVRWYAVPLAVIGAVIAAYHVLIERFPALETGACDPRNPCSLLWVERFGYLTIPTMALTAFVVITALLTLDTKGR